MDWVIKYASHRWLQIFDSVDTLCFLLQLTFQSVPHVFDDIEVWTRCRPRHSTNFVFESVFDDGIRSTMNIVILVDAEADPGGGVRWVRTMTETETEMFWKKFNGVRFGDIDDVLFVKVKAFVHCRLDYCNSLLTGAANVHVKRLQSVQNAN